MSAARSSSVNRVVCLRDESLRNKDDVIDTSELLPSRLITVICHITFSFCTAINFSSVTANDAIQMTMPKVLINLLNPVRKLPQQ